MVWYRTKGFRYTPAKKRWAKRVIGRAVSRWRKRRPTFAARVKRIIARETPDTPTHNVGYNGPICQQKWNVASFGLKEWFVVTPGLSVFERYGSASYTNYVSPTFIIKSWWMKLSIEYNAELLNAYTLAQSEVGYVDLYLVKNREANGPVDTNLVNFYRNGRDMITPNGSRSEELYLVNQNQYQVYMHRRLKMGAAFVRQDGVPSAAVNEQNNDSSQRNV